MKKYLIYGKLTRTLYSIVNWALTDAMAAGIRLKQIHPLEEF